MNEFNLDISDFEKRMSGAIASLKNDFLSLRTGRASSSMIEPVVGRSLWIKTSFKSVCDCNCA